MNGGEVKCWWVIVMDMNEVLFDKSGGGWNKEGGEMWGIYVFYESRIYVFMNATLALKDWLEPCKSANYLKVTCKTVCPLPH